MSSHECISHAFNFPTSHARRVSSGKTNETTKNFCSLLGARKQSARSLWYCHVHVALCVWTLQGIRNYIRYSLIQDPGPLKYNVCITLCTSSQESRNVLIICLQLLCHSVLHKCLDYSLDITLKYQILNRKRFFYFILFSSLKDKKKIAWEWHGRVSKLEMYTKQYVVPH